MPKQKDLKRVVRARMRKTGESYTTARSHLVRGSEPATGYAALAGRSDATILEHTGRELLSQLVALAVGVGVNDRVIAAVGGESLCFRAARGVVHLEPRVYRRRQHAADGLDSAIIVGYDQNPHI